jgi:hypothetical protein
MLYWSTYFVSVLTQKYNVVIDAQNPDIVFYSNMGTNLSQLDTFTGELGKSHDLYGPEVKKIFCSGEDVTYHGDIINSGPNYFAIGPEPYEHPRYLRMQLHNTTAAWGLYEESKLVTHPYDWLLEKRDGDAILQRKKYFCGVVQNSSVPPRIDLYNNLTAYKPVRASGGWITNVPPHEATITHPRIDGEGYRSKVEFLSNCKFSIQVQSSNSRFFTHEKMIHAFAAQTIPLFYGNTDILEDGFNPDCFINCHEYSSMQEVVERVKEIDNNDTLYKKIITEPYFVGNKLPYYYEPEYLLEFFERVLNY